MRNSIKFFTIIALATSLANAKVATPEDKIIGLYIAYYKRAPEKVGLDFWKNSFNVCNNNSNDLKIELKCLYDISKGFQAHSKFNEDYKNFKDQRFVEEIYKNVLGKSGDRDGIRYWSDRLFKQELDIPKFMSDFINSSLTIDIKNTNISDKEKAIAQKRQKLLENKILISKKFIEKLDAKTNIADQNNLNEDKAFKASIKILSGITDEEKSTENALKILNDKKDIDYINNDYKPTEIPTETKALTTKTKLPKTMQTISYAGYDDGNYQAGLTRGFIAKNDILEDNVSKMFWKQTNEVKNYDEAKKFCEDLNTESKIWKLPNKKELETLLNHGLKNLHSNFTIADDGVYLSATQNGDYLTGINFKNGIDIEIHKDRPTNFICVSGSLETNNEIEFIGEKSSALNWYDAIEECNKKGYRLPNINELLSLIESESNPYHYWSSTTNPLNTNGAWSVDAKTLKKTWTYKNDKIQAYCIRDK